MTKAVVVFSGGLDSTICLYEARTRFDKVLALSFNYGQRHAVAELAAANRIAGVLRVEHHRIDCCGILSSRSPLLSGAKLEQFESAKQIPELGLENTFIPMRNMLLFTVAANFAIARDCNYIISGVSQIGLGGYPDCRQSFVDNVEAAIRSGSALNPGDPFFDFHVVTPLMDMSKAEAIRLALHYPGCYQALAYSHTAYDGSYPPTGYDRASVLRAAAFEEADIPDPLILRAFWEGKLPDLPHTKNYRVDRINPNALRPHPSPDIDARLKMMELSFR